MVLIRYQYTCAVIAGKTVDNNMHRIQKITIGHFRQIC